MNYFLTNKIKPYLAMASMEGIDCPLIMEPSGRGRPWWGGRPGLRMAVCAAPG